MSTTMALMLALGVSGGAAVSRNLREISDNGVKSANRMAAAWKKGGNVMSDSMRGVAQVAAMLGGFAAVKGIISDVAEFERGLTELANTGDLTATALKKYRREILSMSRPNLQLPEDQLAAFQKMVAQGVSPDVAIKGLRNIGYAATASFADIKDMASAGIDLIQKMGILPEKLNRSYSIMYSAGKEGKFELKNMAQYFPEVLAAASQYGMTGEKGVAQVSAMLQIAARNRGNPAEAATDMKAFFGHLFTYEKNFAKVGFKVSDFIDMTTGKDGQVSGKFKQGKDIDAFLVELKKKTRGGSAAVLKKMGIQDYEASNFLAGLLRDWSDRHDAEGNIVKGYTSIRDKALSDAGGPILKESFDRNDTTTWANLKRASIDKSVAVKGDTASKGAAGAAGALAKATAWASENPGSAAALAMAGLGAGYSALRLYRGFRAGGVGGGIGGALGGAGGPLPVYVVNKHLSMLPGKGWGFPGEKTSADGVISMAKGTRAAALARLAQMGSIGATLAGGATASALGLALGVPIALAAGVAFGTWFEKKYIGGSWGEKLYDLLHKDKEAENIKNNINLEVKFDNFNRLITRSNDLNTTVNVPNRGVFFDALMTTGGMGY